MDCANDPQCWRERAEVARNQADEVSDEETRRMMLAVADGYFFMAEKAEAALPPRGAIAAKSADEPAKSRRNRNANRAAPRRAAFFVAYIPGGLNLG